MAGLEEEHVGVGRGEEEGGLWGAVGRGVGVWHMGLHKVLPGGLM